MKKLVALITSLVVGIVFTGCTTGNSAEANETTKISVVLKTVSVEYWSYVQYGIEKYEQEHPNVSIDVSGASSETAFDEQLNIIETQLASNKYDAMIISPLMADMVIAKISEYDTPIFAIDTDIDSDRVISFIGTGNERAAYAGGSKAVEMAKKVGWEDIRAIGIAGVQGDTTTTSRMKGYNEGIAEAGGTCLDNELKYANGSADQAVDSMEAIIQQYPDGIPIIFANNDDMALAAARTASGNPAYANTIFVGFNGMQFACESILNGDMSLSVAQDAYNMGYKAVETCMKSLQGEEVDKFVDSGYKIIDKSNAAEYLEQLKKIS